MKLVYFIFTMFFALPLISFIEKFIVFLSSKRFSGITGFFEFILYIIGIVFFLYIFILAIASFIRKIFQDKLQKTLPIIKDKAKVISKHTEIRGKHAHTHFYVAFELESGDRKQFEVTNEEYSFLVEDEIGELYYKEGKGYTFFENFKGN